VSTDGIDVNIHLGSQRPLTVDVPELRELPGCAEPRATAGHFLEGAARGAEPNIATGWHYAGPGLQDADLRTDFGTQCKRKGFE